PLGTAKWVKVTVENLPNGDEIAVVKPWKPPDPFDGITTADMELARQLGRTGEYRADSRSPKWIGYPIADALNIPVAHGAENDPAHMARLKAIIQTWLKNKVLKKEPRKDAKGMDRDFIVSGSFRSPPAPTAYSDDDITIQ